ADGQAVPQEAARGPPPPRVWAKVASGIGVQPAQAPARELPRGSLGCRARARVPPPRTDSQPDAPCRLSIDGFNRASPSVTSKYHFQLGSSQGRWLALSQPPARGSTPGAPLPSHTAPEDHP